MMKSLERIPNGEYNRLSVSVEQNSSVNPELECPNIGKLVGVLCSQRSDIGFRYEPPTIGHRKSMTRLLPSKKTVSNRISLPFVA